MSEPTPKHTPGPWRVMPEEPGRPYIRVRGTQLGERYKIANVLLPDYERAHESKVEESLANARLIAAAPDMLAELKRLAAMTRCAYCGWQKAEVYGHHPGCRLAAVIAKATGATQ
jgi:hypothetical protein